MSVRLPQLLANAKSAGWSEWIKSEADERAVLDGCRFDLPKAERVRTFFARFLVHHKAPWSGKPFDLLPWQWHDVVAPVFGWMNADGFRRYRRAYVEIPKKNGKSTLAAGIALYLLMADGEPSAEVYCAAADRSQAGIVHGSAATMVRTSPALRKVLKITDTTKTIAFPSTLSKLVALSKESGSKEGLDIHALIFDELHIQKDRVLWDTFRYGISARRQPLLFVITTAGSDIEGIGHEQHDYAVGVREGVIPDLEYYPMIYAAHADDDWRTLDTFERANPSFRVTIPERDARAAINEAKNNERAVASYKRYRLNVWSTGEAPFMSPTVWNAAGGDYTETDLEGDECYGGLDLALTEDTTSFVLCFPRFDDEATRYRYLAWFWMPSASIDRKSHLAGYRAWADAGWIRTTPGDVVDYETVLRDIKEISQRFDLREFAYDPWNAESPTQSLESEGVGPRIKFPQTFKFMSEPCKDFIRLLGNGSIEHPKNPVLSWQVLNCQTLEDSNGNIRPSKPKSHDHRKIDGAVSAIMSLARAQLAEEFTGIITL